MWLVEAPGVPWQWAGLSAAFVALAIGLLTIFQRVWGGPRIDLQFMGFTHAHQWRLYCLIRNRPITPLLRFAGIRRERASVQASFTIREAGSARLIGNQIPGEIEDNLTGAMAFRMDVVPSEEATVGFSVVAYGSTGVFMVTRAKLDDSHYLPLGTYAAQVTVMASGKRIKGERRFAVATGGGSPESNLYWTQ